MCAEFCFDRGGLRRTSVRMSRMTTKYRIAICFLSWVSETQVSVGNCRWSERVIKKTGEVARLTHNLFTKRRTFHKVCTHTDHRTRDSEDKNAPPPGLELAGIPQDQSEEKQERELDKVDGGIEKKDASILILDVQVELMREIWRQSFDPGRDIDLRLVVG